MFVLKLYTIHLKKTLSGLYASWSAVAQALQTCMLLRQPVKVLSGTVCRQADQDDTWFVWLAGQKRNLFDISANVGFVFTALLAALRGADRMLLVDPNPTALSRAATNLTYNNRLPEQALLGLL